MKEYSWISLQCEFSWASQLGNQLTFKRGERGIWELSDLYFCRFKPLAFWNFEILRFSPSNKGLPAVPERLCGGLQSRLHLLLWETYSQDNDLPKPRVQDAILIQQLLQKDITSNSPFIQQKMYSCLRVRHLWSTTQKILEVQWRMHWTYVQPLLLNNTE